MNTEDILKQLKKLARPATKFLTGGFKPSNQFDESWIGRVFLYDVDEEIPLDERGEQMIPLAQIYLPGLPFCSSAIKELELLTVFVSTELPGEFEKMGKNWIIREYDSVQKLKQKALENPDSFIKPFPLKPEFVENDYPMWDTDDIPVQLADEIDKLEDEGTIESYEDIAEHAYEHKIGGYPSFCQPGVDFGDDFEFVFQISSDEKAELNIIDDGSLMFSKNTKTGEWKLYYDFY